MSIVFFEIISSFFFGYDTHVSEKYDIIDSNFNKQTIILLQNNGLKQIYTLTSYATKSACLEMRFKITLF